MKPRDPRRGCSNCGAAGRGNVVSASAHWRVGAETRREGRSGALCAVTTVVWILDGDRGATWVRGRAYGGGAGEPHFSKNDASAPATAVPRRRLAVDVPSCETWRWAIGKFRRAGYGRAWRLLESSTCTGLGYRHQRDATREAWPDDLASEDERFSFGASECRWCWRSVAGGSAGDQGPRHSGCGTQVVDGDCDRRADDDGSGLGRTAEQTCLGHVPRAPAVAGSPAGGWDGYEPRCQAGRRGTPRPRGSSIRKKPEMEAPGDGIQQLLAAENEAQQIIKAAREVRPYRALYVPASISTLDPLEDVGSGGPIRRKLTGMGTLHSRY